MDPTTASASPCALGKRARSEHADAPLDQACGSDSTSRDVAAVAAAAACPSASESTGSAAQSQRKRLRHTEEFTRDENGARASLLAAAASAGGAAATTCPTAAARTPDPTHASDCQVRTREAQVDSTCATALDAFLRLQQRDPAVCAAVLQHICQCAPHLLPAQPAPTTHATAASTATPLHQPLEAESPAARQVRMDRLRDSALVTGTIALALSFLPLAERLELGRVSRGWHGATRQASLWKDAGWSFQWDEADSDDSDSDSASQSGSVSDSDSLPLPAWLWSSLGSINCTHTCLVSDARLAAVGSATSAHHLSIRVHHGRSREGQTASAGDIRRALHPLRLLSLTADYRSIFELSPLAEAIIGLPDDASSAEEAEDHKNALEFNENDAAAGTDSDSLSPSLVGQPLMHHWAPTLTELHLYSIRPSDKLLAVLTDLQWPSLRSLSLLPGYYQDGPAVLQFALRLLEALASAQSAPPLAKLRLHGNFDSSRRRSESDYLTAISRFTSGLLATLPQLPGLAELDVDFPLSLHEEQPDGWLPGLHLMPALRVLHCNFNMQVASGRAFVKSIALAPRLEELQLLTVGAASEVCTELQKRCAAASAASSSSMDGGTRSAPVMLRELSFLAVDKLGRRHLQALALLPHLESLSCRVSRDSIYWLGGLLGLRSLTLLDVDWKDADVRLLAALPLPLLSTLELHPRYKEGSGFLSRRKMVLSELTVSGSLRHLLQLPSLSHLGLPLLSPSAQAALHTLLVHSGRSATLRVEVEEAEEEEDDESVDRFKANPQKKQPSLFLRTDQAAAASTTIVLNDR